MVSVVGMWITELAGVHAPRVLAKAGEMGHAMQLTNILRDVGEDWRQGRLYLPADVMERHGVTEDSIARMCGGAAVLGVFVPGTHEPPGKVPVVLLAWAEKSRAPLYMSSRLK